MAAKFVGIGCLLLIVAIPQPVHAVDIVLDDTISVPGTTTANRHADAVSATDIYMISGSPRDDALGADAGAVYVFKKVNDAWVQIQ